MDRINNMADLGGMNPPIATQFVQYANDALDVYYSDGSRLQLSACGTAFRYYHPPYAGQHPLHGQKEIQQRSEFVTSEFRPKVQDAVEFRNRFSERPFLCRNLIPAERIVRLHADIEEVAWPEKADDAEVISYPDGSVRLVSADEYAAVTLPGHRQYLTTEVLCKMSQRPASHRAHPSQLNDTAFPSPIANTSNTHNITRTPDQTGLSVVVPPRPSSRETPIPYPNSHPSVTDQQKSPTQTNTGFDTKDGGSTEGKWEYVWISQHVSLTEVSEVWKHPLQILLQFVEDHKNDITLNVCDDTPLPPPSPCSEFEHTPPKGKSPSADAKNRTGESSGDDASCAEDGEHSLSSLSESISSIFSTHGLKQSRIGETAMSETERRAVTLQRLLKKDFAGCLFIPSPRSLPLKCPALHLHRWKPDVITSDDNERAEAAYMYGKVKVICSQGIIYRLIWHNPRNVEIYPGDGSIMRSTGLSGHFFSHFIQRPHQVLEKTYSVQTPPPTPPGAPYSVAKLIARGARFLQHLCEESLQSLLHDDPCCWAVKPSESRPVEPLPTVLLEECMVEGMGHFTAYSNGLIRVLFTDRTSLEMTFDFSKRVLGDEGKCDPETVKRYLRRPKPLHLVPGVVRLMLRSGLYHQVDVNHPEGYESYVKAAVQWAEWVNSTPSERYVFYKDTIYDQHKLSSIDSELKKIQCFNYIVDNMVVPPKPTTDANHPSKHHRNSTVDVVERYSNLEQAHVEEEPRLADLGIHLPQVSTTHQSQSGVMNLSSIQDVLRQTAAAVADLDRFMKSNINYKPPR